MSKAAKKVIGGQVSPAEYENITTALREAGFKNTSAGVRGVLLAFSLTRTLSGLEASPTEVACGQV